nr:MAG TPA: hypothetical protein [Caudoviricetes sp.]
MSVSFLLVNVLDVGDVSGVRRRRQGRLAVRSVTRPPKWGNSGLPGRQGGGGRAGVRNAVGPHVENVSATQAVNDMRS